MRSYRFFRLMTLLISVASVGGCGPQSNVAPVTGVIKLGDEPLEFIQVEFWPDGGQRSFGKTDATGKYELQTDDRKEVGATPGVHKVVLKDTWHMQDDYIGEGGDWVDMSKGRKSRISSKYYDVLKTPLSVTVKPNEANQFDFAADPIGK